MCNATQQPEMNLSMAMTMRPDSPRRQLGMS
jgi:hypothetical protein